ncbi:MAG TPA: S8 family peptidase [Prosthecobacter sp.]|jgi:hypothetical protein|nr:S8 family peptidase [Prosthecobacter sp.]
MPLDSPVTLRHLDYSGRAKQQPYKARQSGGGSDFRLYPRQRAGHAAKLRGDLQAVQLEADRLRLAQELAPFEDDIGINLEIRGVPDYPLNCDPFDADPKSGIILKAVRQVDSTAPDGTTLTTTVATVFVRHGKLSFLTKRIEDYVNERKTTITKGKHKGEERSLDHEKLIANIESIGVAAIEAFWTSSHPLPALDVETWWEVWIWSGSEVKRARHEQVVECEADRLGMYRKPGKLVLPEHSIYLLKTTRRQLAAATALLNFVSELRHPAVTAQFFMEQTPTEKRQWSNDLKSRVQLPPDNAPAICLLDTGVNRGHPLLEDILAESEHDTANEDWGTDDHYHNGHGTQMAGLAAYGDLTPLLEGNEEVVLSHHIESVKILPRSGANDPEHYGLITQDGMAIAEQNAPGRPRVFAMAVTAVDAKDFRENGKPSAWSAAIDSHASGAMEDDDVKRLICVSAGNVWLKNKADYPSLNQLNSIEDPAQSWNGITVSAFTDKDIVTDENGQLIPEVHRIARRGGLSPHSTTSCLWNSPDSKNWPLKPDIVCEGGNVGADAVTGAREEHDSLCLLSTNADFQKDLFSPFYATSAATALGANMAAQIQAAYPNYWPETVRAVIIHSANWTDEMRRGLNLRKKSEVAYALQQFGHGVPDLRRALACARSRATLICQDSLQPFTKEKDGIKTQDMMLYRLPWPKEVLQQHGAVNVRLRVTLSYFIEPNPGSRSVSSKYRYANCNLRFAVQTPTEKSLSNFIARVSDSASSDGEETSYEKPDDTTTGWLLGDTLCRRGSIHSDTWNGTAAQLASMEHLIVYPVNGWWRLRTQHKRYNNRIRYALVLSLETVGAELDIFTPISLRVTAPVEV